MVTGDGERPRGRIEGALIAVRQGAVHGWAFDPEGPDAAELVQILVDGVVVAEGHAGLMRRPLRAQGKGNGRHGFRIPIPSRMLNGREATVSARIAPDGPELKGSGGRYRLLPDTPAPRVDLSAVPPAGQAIALLGRHDWLFLCNHRVMEQAAGLVTLDAGVLDAYEAAFRARVDRLRSAGVPYLFTAVPMKERMCTHMLPNGFPVVTGPTPWDQVLEVARRVPGMDMIDLRPMMAARMAHEQLYFRTDHHINLLGAYYVYRELLVAASRYREDLAPRPYSDFAYREWPEFHGDMVDRQKAAFRDGAFILEPDPATEAPGRWAERAMHHDFTRLQAREVTEIPDTHDVSAKRQTRIFERDDPSLPTAVIVRDSFSEQVMPFLAEHFRRSVFVWVPDPPFDVIEIEQPDIVLHIKAERFLIYPPALPA